jgi:hypothetical protein
MKNYLASAKSGPIRLNSQEIPSVKLSLAKCPLLAVSCP